ncbi:uncharacterized protein LOC135165018 [Diachasmimorpha longicaudata]|uniref:uncharacterized protein LOC135165018 n=1 Tax=Diachasmimorpha longicaudata TaxID=58733 RepID=UPI0030B8F807
MPLYATPHRLPQESMSGVNPGVPPQIVPISCTPPPSSHNINLLPGHPANFVGADRGAPPSYEQVIDSTGPPPSYDSLFGRVREVPKASKAVLDFLLNIVVLLVGTIGCTFIIGVTILIPVCMMIMGGVYLYDCPQSEYIPVYLLVGGGFGVFKQLLHLSTLLRRRPEERDEERIRLSPTQTLINCFMLGWLIIGSLWVYKEYEPNYDPANGKHCNKTLYLFAFWLITALYIYLGVITASLCCISLASAIVRNWASDDLVTMRMVGLHC